MTDTALQERVTVSRRRSGAIRLPDGRVRWRVWAPYAKRVELVLYQGEQSQHIAMAPDEPEYFAVEAEAEEGVRYAFSLDGGEDRPDPCSLWQPDGLPGPSAVIFPENFKWTDDGWRGVARPDLVIYELHVGTFTQEGTFDAIIPRLADLKDLGITAIEILPVAQFPGTRNWGYDGVLPYAAHHSYGGPQGLARLVDAAHAHGLAVILDVVYNHFGPEFAFFHEFGPYLTDKYRTPWGKAVNYDDAGCDGVRDFVLDNARMWLEDFHLDGLRLDAVHAIYDLGARHILRAIHDVAEEVSELTGRQINIIGESDLNDPRMILPPERGGNGLDAQWSDDFHHAIHALLTDERRGYYSDYGEIQQIAKVMENPFVFAWEYSKHRKRKHGAPLPADVSSGDHFVVCIQNHDQVGNRAIGDRLTALLKSPAKQRLASSLLLLSPYVPMLFMGEEYGEQRPFPFFCSFCGDELVCAVRDGRKREFADFVDDASEIPDPNALETFNLAKLSWSWPRGSFEGGLRHLYKDLLTARKQWLAMRDFNHRAAKLLPDIEGPAVLQLVRGRDANSAMVCCFNLTATKQDVPDDAKRHDGTVLFSSEWKHYSGSREKLAPVTEMLPFETLVYGPATSWQPASS